MPTIYTNTEPASAGTVVTNTEPSSAGTVISNTEPAVIGTVITNTEPSVLGTDFLQREPIQGAGLNPAGVSDEFDRGAGDPITEYTVNNDT